MTSPSINPSAKPIQEKFAYLPPNNAWLSSPIYGITHVDPSQSDSIPYGPPRGTYYITPEKQPIVYGGPVNIMTLAATNPDYMWSVGTDHVAYVCKKSGQWYAVTHINAPAYLSPSLKPIPPSTQQKFGTLSAVGMDIKEMDEILKACYGMDYPLRIKNGGYSVCDHNNVLYANFGRGAYAFSLVDPNDPTKGIWISSSIEDLSVFANGNTSATVFGLSFTFDGKLIVVFNVGLAVLDLNFQVASSWYYPFTGETVSNSVAVDKNNGIYIATNKTMRKLIWTGDKISDAAADGAWSCPYEAPDDMPPVIKFDTGTGSTPTLMGFDENDDKLVVITDGAKRMNLVAFWRDEIPSGFSHRIAGQIPVTCGINPPPEWIQSEQSVVVYGYDAFVVNNIPADTTALAPVSSNKILVVSLMGPAYPGPTGVERFHWNTQTHQWTSTWARPDVSSTSMVPIQSQLTKMVFVNGYDEETGWEVTGMDWNTGATLHKTIFGKDNYGNGAYAILQYLENGDLLFNSIVGPMRVSYSKSSSTPI